MSDEPDTDLVAAALNRYLAARARTRSGVPGAAEQAAAARAGLVRLLRQAGWEPPASSTGSEAHDREDRAARRRSA